MNYIIHTPSATRLKKEVLDRVSKNEDANDKDFATWQVAETDVNEQVLVHTIDQWEDKGCIALKQVPGCNELQVRL